MFQTGSMYYNFWDQVVVKSNECITLSSYLGKKIGFLTVINIGLCFIIQTELRDNVQCSRCFKIFVISTSTALQWIFFILLKIRLALQSV